MKKTKLTKQYYYHNVKLIKIVDGDTFRLNIDMGNHIHWEENFRLYGIDTPELSTEEGKKVKKLAIELFKNKKVEVETYAPDKYGRWLAEIFFIDKEEKKVNYNMWIIDNGYSKQYYGGKKG